MNFLKHSFPWIAIVILLSSCGLEPPKLREKEAKQVEETPTPPVSEEAEPEKPKPIPRMLTDKEGRQIDATIIGHAPGYLTIIRSLDNQRFELAVVNLSEQDQAYVRSLPMFDPPSASDEPETEPEEKEHSINNFQQSRIDAIEEEIDQLKEELKNYERKTIKWRTVTSEIERLEAEKQKLLAELNE